MAREGVVVALSSNRDGGGANIWMNETRWERQKPDEALILINTISLLKLEIFNHNIGIFKICEKI